MMKTKDKDKILKATREEWQMTYKGIPIRLSADISTETLQARGNGTIYLKWFKGRTYNQEYSTQQDFRLDFRNQKFSR